MQQNCSENQKAFTIWMYYNYKIKYDVYLCTVQIQCILEVTGTMTLGRHFLKISTSSPSPQKHRDHILDHCFTADCTW